MIFFYYAVKSKWHYIVLVAILVQAFLIYKQPNYEGNSDAESAIRRAKTDSCKKELKDFATSSLYYSENQTQLRRSCKLDSNKQRNQQVGCASNHTSHQLIKLEEPVVNSSVCLDLCFIYGHSHGGYNSLSKSCFCGDNESTRNQLHHHQSDGCNGPEEFEWFKVDVGIFHPDKPPTWLPSTEKNNGRPIKIAFLLILSGRSAMHIRRLLRNIYSDAHIYYVHVDKRDDYLFNELLCLETEYKNVFLARSRFNTIWGGPSLLRMIIDAMEHLAQHDWDYLINLSESDFPIKPIDELEDYLATTSNATKPIYLKTHNIRGYNFIDKQGLNRNFYQCEDRVWRMGKRHLPRGIVYSGGSDWFALPKDFCMYIIDNMSNSKSLVKPLIQIYNFTLLPAESFFHTLALNSEFCDRFIDNNLRVTNWHRKQGCKCQHKNVVDWCGCSPLVYRSSDWEKLAKTKTSSLFFSRKFDPTISSSVIEAVEYKLIGKKNSSSGFDSRYWQNVYNYNEFNKTNDLYRVFQQFGLFALNQTESLPISKFTSPPQLKFVDLYFNRDRFVGLLYHYCTQSLCIQVLIEKNSEPHLRHHNSKCFESNERALKAIEVNHGFDTGERMFRDYRPLNHLSDIVVYHEWFVDMTKRVRKNSTESLQFIWTNPKARIEIVQNVKLRGSTKPIRLTLAHRLDIQKPLDSGLWTLTISRRNRDCLNYNFLVFDQSTFVEQNIHQETFNSFYRVSQSCIVSSRSNNEGESTGNLCSNSEWSLLSKSRNVPTK